MTFIFTILTQPNYSTGNIDESASTTYSSGIFSKIISYTHDGSENQNDPYSTNNYIGDSFTYEANDGIDDENDRCPGTKVGDQVDEDGCSANQIVGEIADGENSLPGLSFVVSIVAVLGLAILRKPRL